MYLLFEKYKKLFLNYFIIYLLSMFFKSNIFKTICFFNFSDSNQMPRYYNFFFYVNGKNY